MRKTAGPTRTDERRPNSRATLTDEQIRTLAQSQGFSVESRVGRLGSVEAVRFGGQPRQPFALVVRVPEPEADTIVLVPVASIEAIVPESRQILLRRGVLWRQPAEGHRMDRAPGR